MTQQHRHHNAARKNAQRLVAEQAVSPTRRRGWQIAIILFVVAVIGCVAYAVNSLGTKDVPSSGPVPKSANEFGGIVLSKDSIQLNSSSVTTRDQKNLLASTASTSPNSRSRGRDTTLPIGVECPHEASCNGKPVRVTLVEDLNCLYCARLTQAYGNGLKQQVLDGKVTLEIRPVNFMDPETRTEYSSRAAMAAYSVAEQVSPAEFLDWQAEIFTHQGKGGLSNSELAEIAAKHGASIEADVDSQKYWPMVNTVSDETKSNGLTAVPTYYADGITFDENNLMTFLDRVESQKTRV